MNIFETLLENLFGGTDGKNAVLNYFLALKKSRNATIQTTYTPMTKITKTLVDADGNKITSIVAYAEGNVTENEMNLSRIEDLTSQKDEALRKEDYEKCAEIQKELKLLLEKTQKKV